MHTENKYNVFIYRFSLSTLFLKNRILNRFVNLIDAQQKMYPDRTYTINDNGNTYYWQLGTEPWQENQYIWGKDADGNIRPFKIEGDIFKEYLE